MTTPNLNIDSDGMSGSTRHPATCTASVVERVMPLWAQIKKRDKIGSTLLSKIIFDPCFVNYSDSELSDGDNRDMVCFITFNTHAKSLEGLLTSEGHLTKDGREFVKAAQTVLKFDLEQEGDTFMWYRSRLQQQVVGNKGTSGTTPAKFRGATNCEDAPIERAPLRMLGADADLDGLEDAGTGVYAQV
ncbi:hypothetical protein GGX14DRAFT_398080 [Mycena pura]|uniref:Uncharacterized protein n=1 Tax=Mycena pura TaxID=153505 RepID=A0AAD6Y6W2_9AGAR|nr:hypothetical protein GGX14DRAFT_398080 [Mycena pura]